MTQKIFTIITLILGIILGSMANITSSVIPAKVNFDTNENVKIVLNSDKSTISIQGKSLVPIHYDTTTTKFYKSNTLSMEDLVEDTSKSNILASSVQVALDTNIANTYPQVEFIATSEDEINKALRCLVIYENERYLLEPSDTITLNSLINKENKNLIAYIYYELDDESVSVENMNNAKGSEISINIYAYTKE